MINIIKKLNNISFFDQKEKDSLIENLSILLNSGLNISSALNNLSEDIRSKKLKEDIVKAQVEIESGRTFWSVLEENQLLSPHYISLVKVGEETGTLNESLISVVDQKTKENDLKSKIKGALSYPIFIFVVAAVLGIGISWFLLPRLSTVFNSLELELPLLTRIMIYFGTFLRDYGIFAVPSILVTLLMSVYFTFFYYKTKFIGEKILFSIPVFKRIIQEVESARLGYVFSTLLNSGLSLNKSVDSLGESTSFKKYKQFYSYLTDSITEGNTFYQSFKRYENIHSLFPSSVIQLVKVGEQSGTLPSSLEKVGEIYEKKVDNTVKNLSVLLEPVMLIIIWMGVVFLALSVILPIYSLLGNLNTDPNSRSSTASPTTTIEETQKESSIEEEFVEEATVTPSPSLVEENYDQIIITETPVGFLNVREEPNIESDILDQLEPQTIHYLFGVQEDWYEISISSVEDIENEDTIEEVERGWVINEYVNFIE